MPLLTRHFRIAPRKETSSLKNDTTLDYFLKPSIELKILKVIYSHVAYTTENQKMAAKTWRIILFAKMVTVNKNVKKKPPRSSAVRGSQSEYTVLQYYKVPNQCTFKLIWGPNLPYLSSKSRYWGSVYSFVLKKDSVFEDAFNGDWAC